MKKLEDDIETHSICKRLGMSSMSANYVILAFWVQSLLGATEDMVERESDETIYAGNRLWEV